jgi:hypothetical protein
MEVEILLRLQFVPFMTNYFTCFVFFFKPLLKHHKIHVFSFFFLEKLKFIKCETWRFEHGKQNMFLKVTNSRFLSQMENNAPRMAKKPSWLLIYLSLCSKNVVLIIIMSSINLSVYFIDSLVCKLLFKCPYKSLDIKQFKRKTFYIFHSLYVLYRTSHYSWAYAVLCLVDCVEISL